MTNTQIGFVLCERMLSSGLSLPIEMWKSAASSYLAAQKNERQHRYAPGKAIAFQALSTGKHFEGQYHRHKQFADPHAQ